MNIEKGKISNAQLLLLIVGFIEGSTFLAHFASNLAGRDTWLTVLSGLTVTVPFLYSYVVLIKRFPGRNFARINQIIYGRYPGTAISLFFLSYFFLILSLNIKDEGDYYLNFFMGDTPIEIILIVFTGVCAYAAWNGIEVLARVTPFIVAFISLVIIGTTLMVLPKMDFSNFLPLGELTFKNFFHSTQIIAEIPFGEWLCFLPLAFALNDSKPIVKTFLSGVLSGAAFFMVIVVRNTAVLSNTEAMLIAPSIQAVRLINFGFLSRLDILFATGHTVAIFLKCSILFYVTVLFLAQIFELRTYSPMIFPLGCLTAILGKILYPSSSAHIESAQNVEVMLYIPLMFLLPPLSLFIAKIRKLPGKESSKQ
jgi:spore germination protein KB